MKTFICPSERSAENVAAHLETLKIYVPENATLYGMNHGENKLSFFAICDGRIGNISAHVAAVAGTKWNTITGHVSSQNSIQDFAQILEKKLGYKIKHDRL